MGYYVIGVGGTGSKCVEALIHLAAAGMMPDDEEIFTVFVDPDSANGNLDRTVTTLVNYQECNGLQYGKSEIFKTKIEKSNPPVWSPFDQVDPTIQNDPTLEKLFLYNNMKTLNEDDAHLFELFYSNSERQTSLKEGYRGHPSIGAAVMANTLRFGNTEPWRAFRTKILADIGAGRNSKIILIGSIFGGTGASGIPTIARLIREEINLLRNQGNQNNQANNRVFIGCVLMLPYFQFNPVHGENLKADSEDFLSNTKIALQYYYHQNYLNTYDKIYLLGENSLSQMGQSSIGGNTQRNEPHLLELYAGLACMDFFKMNDGANNMNYMMIARNQAGKVEWSDLPCADIKDKLGNITRFAFAFLTQYYPVLIDSEKIRDCCAPWYIDFFVRQKMTISRQKKDLDNLKKYCMEFLQWLTNIQTSINGLDVELINYTSFSDPVGNNGGKWFLKRSNFEIDKFSNLTLPIGKDDINGLDRLWRRMCSANVKDNNAAGLGKFIHALYRECSIP